MQLGNCQNENVESACLLSSTPMNVSRLLRKAMFAWSMTPAGAWFWTSRFNLSPQTWSSAAKTSTFFDVFDDRARSRALGMLRPSVKNARLCLTQSQSLPILFRCLEKSFPAPDVVQPTRALQKGVGVRHRFGAGLDPAGSAGRFCRQVLQAGSAGRFCAQVLRAGWC
jgi:hypothetical protein